MDYSRLVVPLTAATAICLVSPASAEPSFFTSAKSADAVATTSASFLNCPAGSYQNSSGNCVPSPNGSTADVTAVCRDGSYSHSQHHSGTCSSHGGVGQWCPCNLPPSQSRLLPR